MMPTAAVAMNAVHHRHHSHEPPQPVGGPTPIDELAFLELGEMVSGMLPPPMATTVGDNHLILRPPAALVPLVPPLPAGGLMTPAEQRAVLAKWMGASPKECAKREQNKSLAAKEITPSPVPPEPIGVL